MSDPTTAYQPTVAMESAFHRYQIAYNAHERAKTGALLYEEIGQPITRQERVEATRIALDAAMAALRAESAAWVAAQGGIKE